MTCIHHMRRLPAAIPVISLVLVMSGADVGAAEAGAQSRVEEHPVEFYNEGVKLAGSLLLPGSEAPLPAVVFVHGAGRQTRESYREAGEFFAGQGIAALIYDKRGTGLSGGAYESHRPYENLVNDVVSAVAFLKQRREIAVSRIGIWGLSQGAYIGASAASRTEDIGFVIAVGASAADGAMFYYRDNLFRLYGLSDNLRDVAEKAYLAQQDLHQTVQAGFSFTAFASHSYPAPDQYVHPAWSQVKQPVLAMWGQLDQNVPVGESVAGLKNSLAYANNRNWTMIILPQANHSLGISETGALQSKWRGYPPGALRTMTDWVRSAIDDPSQIGTMKQEGVAPETGVLSSLAGYEGLRWYGNAAVQSALLVLFMFSFVPNAIAGIRRGLIRLLRRRQGATLQMCDRLVNFTRAICALNVLILVAFAITTLLVMDQIRPSCPSVLMFLPLLGTVSTLATVAMLSVIARSRRDHGLTVARRIRRSFDVLCVVLFVPYMFYWNLIGLRF